MISASYKKALVAFLCAVLLVGLCPTQALIANAEEANSTEPEATLSSSTYSTGSLTTPKPTKAQIKAKFKSMRDYASKFYVSEPKTTSPYSLGKVSAATLNNAEDWLNYVRFAANLPAVSLDDEANTSAQYGAVILAATGKLTHYPSRPSGMTDAFFTQASTSCSSSNIAVQWMSKERLGSFGEAVTLWMDDEDSSNIDTVGHRRWILNPAAITMGIGAADCYGTSGQKWRYSALRVLNRSGIAKVDLTGSVKYDSIAWPASGNFPNNVFTGDTPWSLTLNPSNYEVPDVNKVSVKLTRKSDNKSWSLKEGCSSGYFNVDTGSYAVGNCIIFRPNDLGTSALEGDWKVEVSGIFKKGATTSTTISYTVNFFDVHEDDVVLNRLYNPYSGEHFYTASVAEKEDLVKIGWRSEGTGWLAPKTSNTPVYRLYNPYTGDHHYTMSEKERGTCVSNGWRYEGIGWYSDDAKSVKLYRQFNPYATVGTHNYTTSETENNELVRLGWRAEGTAWYGVK